MREVGDSLEGMIRLTADYPSNHLVAASSFPRSDWCVVAATALASPIAAVRINVLLPSLLIASLVAAASLFCSGPYLLSVCLTSV